MVLGQSSLVTDRLGVLSGFSEGKNVIGNPRPAQGRILDNLLVDQTDGFGSCSGYQRVFPDAKSRMVDETLFLEETDDISGEVSQANLIPTPLVLSGQLAAVVFAVQIPFLYGYYRNLIKINHEISFKKRNLDLSAIFKSQHH